MQRTKAAIPRRSRRQPAAPGGAERGARQARRGRDHRRRSFARSRTARSRRSSGSRRRSASSSRPTASFAAPGGSSTSTRASTASSCITTGKGISFAGVETKAESVRIVGKVGFSGHPHARAFQVSQGAHQRHAEDDHSGAEHAALPAGPAVDRARRPIPTSTPSSTIVAEAYRKAIRAFYDAGCRYLQMDDTAWSMMCDPKEREQSQRARRRSGHAAARYTPR